MIVAVILGDAVSIATCLLFAALGGLMTELGGMLNIALEGLILIGAFAGAAAAGAGRSLLLGIAAGMGAATLAAWIYGVATLRLKANEFITGLATNLLAAGITVVVSEHVFLTKGVVPFDIAELPRLGPGFLRSLPFLGELLFRHNVLVYASWLAVPLAWLLVWKTPFGMRLRAAGSSPRSLVALGIDPDRYRLGAVLISGAACGLAGCYLSLGLSAFVPNMSSGRGWIALVAIYLGGKRPLGVAAACFLFALADSFANFAQGFLRIPPDFILALPYAITLLALVVGAAVKRAGGGPGAR